MRVGITGWGVSVADVSSTMHLNREVGKPQHSDVSWYQSCGQTLKVHSMPTRSRSEQKLCLGPTNANNSLVIWRSLPFPQTKMKQPFMLCTQQPTHSTTQTSTARLQTLVCSKRRIKGLSVWNQESHQGSSGALFLTRFLSKAELMYSQLKKFSLPHWGTRYGKWEGQDWRAEFTPTIHLTEMFRISVSYIHICHRWGTDDVPKCLGFFGLCWLTGGKSFWHNFGQLQRRSPAFLLLMHKLGSREITASVWAQLLYLLQKHLLLVVTSNRRN